MRSRFVVEGVRRAIAACRTLASGIHDRAAGRDGDEATWGLSRRVFLTSLGLVYAIAFASLWRQLAGLFGSRGIAPLAELLEWQREARGVDWLRLPTVFWLGASDATLDAVCAAGVALSALLMLGIAPRYTAALLWLGYLSFVSVGYPFLSFQWDALLLETGLLAALYAPGGLRPFRLRRARERPPSAVLRFLLRWLLFRLMFLSGVVKLASGDEVWRDLTALEYHYWTQPLPHRISHYVQHLPAGFHAFCLVVVFAIELGLPFFVFGPRRLRHLACAGFVLLMALITATGNYGFFNLLTVVLCVPLLDDRALRRVLPFLRSHDEPEGGAAPARGWPAAVRRGLVGLFALAVVSLTAAVGALRVRWIEAMPAALAPLDEAVAGLATFNAYGLFADMTEERPEIVVEGSSDGVTWKPYRFRYKPGDPEAAPAFAGPYMPRLDWQMWFAALRGRPEGWYPSFVRRLLEGSRPVLDLLAEDPFDGAPPRFVRSTLYDYTFGSPRERAAGVWWRRTEARPFGPTWTLDAEGALRQAPRRAGR